METEAQQKYFGQDLRWLKSERGRAVVEALLAKYDLPCGMGIHSVLYDGHSGGSFVDAICRGDMMGAYRRADLNNQGHFMNYIKFAHELSMI